MTLISTTALSKTLNIPTKGLFQQLLTLGFIQKENESWILTPEGQKKGGAYKTSIRYGQYIVWPADLNISTTLETEARSTSTKLITATVIGREFGLSANKINFILSELGWVKKGLEGWLITDQGSKQNGIQAEDRKSGIPYVRWPAAITTSKSLTETIDQVKGTSKAPVLINPAQKEEESFRDKFKAEHRSADGHFVRSKAEMLIDNWLYMAEIVHAYERKLPIEEDVYSDFYIPTGKVYIEYWGYENDPRYLTRKQKKIELYKKYGFNLIELQDKEVQNLDDVLPRLLLKYGVRAY